MNDIFDKIEEWIEALAIRILHIWHATSFKKRPGLCPPQCSEGHTYRWPCRQRIRKPVKSKVGEWRDVTVIRDIPTGDLRGTEVVLDGSVTYYSFSAPKNPELGDRWQNANTDQRYMWNGDKWVEMIVARRKQESEAHHGAPPKGYGGL